jgi:site-specific recombinase XerD
LREPYDIAVYRSSDLTDPAKPVSARNAPEIVKGLGQAAEFAWEEFFQGRLANPHTRKNYIHAVKRFLEWCDEHNLQLIRVTPGDVGAYFQELQLAVPTKKLHLAAQRRFFDRLVNRHVIVINPAAIDICRMIKRRLKAAGLPDEYSPHSFRVATVTDLLEQNVELESVQDLAGHADPRTTMLYDRRRRKVTRNSVERISI